MNRRVPSRKKKMNSVIERMGHNFNYRFLIISGPKDQEKHIFDFLFLLSEYLKYYRLQI